MIFYPHFFVENFCRPIAPPFQCRDVHSTKRFILCRSNINSSICVSYGANRVCNVRHPPLHLCPSSLLFMRQVLLWHLSLCLCHLRFLVLSAQVYTFALWDYCNSAECSLYLSFISRIYRNQFHLSNLSFKYALTFIRFDRFS